MSARPSSPIDCCQSVNCPSRPRTSSSTAPGLLADAVEERVS
ncbi:hypothetical protein ABZY45_02645 [Streptomyces sp. NPDC006516]